MSTLKRSERNSIIEDYRNGVLNPNYEVIQTKTKGRYTVRKRKVPLTDEQLEQLNDIAQGVGHDDNIDHAQPTSAAQQSNVKNSVKRSKKENALFDLQNQLNTQMLYRITELTNKVTKLKAWKKKMKTSMYEEDQAEPIDEQQQIQQDEQQSEAALTGSPTGSPTGSGEALACGALACGVSHMIEQDVNSHQYLEQIPQQYIEEPTYIEKPTYMDEPTYEPNYVYGARGGIDYSKFGF